MNKEVPGHQAFWAIGMCRGNPLIRTFLSFLSLYTKVVNDTLQVGTLMHT